MKPPFIWAHRGASCCAPENTMLAFTRALEHGANGLELDVHLSGDGVPVVLHDDTLDRTTDGHGPVSRCSLRHLQELDAGGWFSEEFTGEPIPVLEDVLQIFGSRMRLNLELKDVRSGMAVLELLTRYPSADAVISSFNYDLLLKLRSVDKTLPLAVLFDSGRWRHAFQIAKDISACAFHPAANKVSRPMVAACLRAGLPVSVWTVDSPSIARSLLRGGVSGFFTNDPRTLRSALCSSSPTV